MSLIEFDTKHVTDIKMGSIASNAGIGTFGVRINTIHESSNH